MFSKVRFWEKSSRFGYPEIWLTYVCSKFGLFGKFGSLIFDFWAMNPSLCSSIIASSLFSKFGIFGFVPPLVARPSIAFELARITRLLKKASNGKRSMYSSTALGVVGLRDLGMPYMIFLKKIYTLASKVSKVMYNKRPFKSYKFKFAHPKGPKIQI